MLLLHFKLKNLHSPTKVPLVTRVEDLVYVITEKKQNMIFLLFDLFLCVRTGGVVRLRCCALLFRVPRTAHKEGAVHEVCY